MTDQKEGQGTTESKQLSSMDKVLALRKEKLLAGGLDRIEAQHAKGKLTARERIGMLLDPGTFQEVDAYMVHRQHDFGLDKKHPLGDGVTGGFGKIDGRMVCVYAQDFTILGGSFGEVAGKKICKLMEMAIQAGVPVIGMNDGGGARIQEGIHSLAAYGDLFYLNTMASGVVPQISLILGPCAGGAVYSPAITDFILMAKNLSNMFITGPAVIKSVTGEEVDTETLGGAVAHATLSGVAHFVSENEEGTLQLTRQLLSYLPSNNRELPPGIPPQDNPSRMDKELDSIVPANAQEPYDMKTIINKVFDFGSFLEVHASFAQNAIVGLARLHGQPVGVVAQQPAYLAGTIDIDASDKIARFVRFCDAFHLPVITFADSPGFLPGVSQEHGGIIRHGAKIIVAYAEATIPKLTIITRKGYGGAYIVMGSKHLRADQVFAWPTAQIAVMGPEGAVNILYGKELANAQNQAEERARLEDEFREKFANPFRAAELGYVDDVILPSETRPRLIAALELLRDKQETIPPRKHGSIPL